MVGIPFYLPLSSPSPSPPRSHTLPPSPPSSLSSLLSHPTLQFSPPSPPPPFPHPSPLLPLSPSPPCSHTLPPSPSPHSSLTRPSPSPPHFFSSPPLLSLSPIPSPSPSFSVSAPRPALFTSARRPTWPPHPKVTARTAYYYAPCSAPSLVARHTRHFFTSVSTR